MATKINSVTESATLLRAAVDDMTASEAAALTLIEAGENDLALFGKACVSIFRAIEAGGVTAKAISQAAKAAKAATFSHPSQVGYCRMAGRVLSQTGELPDGVTSRKVKAQFECQMTIAGSKVDVGVKAGQFAALPAEAFADQTTAYKALRKIVLANEEAARKAAGEAADKAAGGPVEPGDVSPVEPGDVSPVEPVEVTTADMLTEALALLEAVASKIGGAAAGDDLIVSRRILAVAVALTATA